MGVCEIDLKMKYTSSEVEDNYYTVFKTCLEKNLKSVVCSYNLSFQVSTATPAFAALAAQYLFCRYFAKHSPSP